MSDNIELHRSWKSSDDDTTTHCYLSMRHRITLRELVDYLAERHPHADPWEVALNFATATWDEPSTDGERDSPRPGRPGRDHGRRR